MLIKHGPGSVDDEEQEEKIFPAQPDPTNTVDPYKGMLTKKTAKADYSPQGRPTGQKRPTYWEYRCRCLDISGGTPPLAMIEPKHEEEYVAIIVEEPSELA